MDKVGEKGLKEKIIEAAHRLLLSEGYRNFSLRKVASEIGVSATSIYLHFDNKDDLVHALIDKAIERLNRRLMESTLENNNPIENLRSLAQEYMDFALENPREYQIIYLVSSDEMTRYPKDKFRKVRKGYDIVTSVLKRGVKAEQISQLKPRISAYTFWAQLHGVTSVVISRRLDSRIDKNEFIEEAIEHIINGYQRSVLINK